MRSILLVSFLTLASCYTPPYDFSYENEKMMYGAGNPSMPGYSNPKSNFTPSTLGGNIKIPPDLQLPGNQPQSNYNDPYGSNPYNNAPSQQPQQNTNSPYSSPYANPYGYAPYGSPGNQAHKVKAPVNNNVNKAEQKNLQTNPYSGYVKGKNHIFSGSNSTKSNAPAYSGNININKPTDTNNLKKAEQADRYRGLTDTNKYEVIDTNVFSEKDRNRFGLIESDIFSPNNNFDKYKSMYDKKESKKTQDFVDSLDGNLLDEMIKNDPISNGFGLENIPKY